MNIKFFLFNKSVNLKEMLMDPDLDLFPKPFCSTVDPGSGSASKFN